MLFFFFFFPAAKFKTFSGRTVMKDLLKEWKEKPPGGAPPGEFYFRVPWQQTLRLRGREYLWPSVFHFIWVELMKLQLRVLEGIVHAAFWCYYLLLKLLEAVWLPFRLHRWFFMHMTQFSPTCGALRSITQHYWKWVQMYQSTALFFPIRRFIL